MLRCAGTGRSLSMLWLAAAYAAAAVAAVGIAIWLSPTSSPLAVAAVADLVATLVVFAFSVALDNSSVYDPYWSVAPPALAAYWMSTFDAWNDPRCLVMFVLIAVWAIRLTGNCIDRWQGLGHEDWRYAQFRGRWSYWLISLSGFHLMPTIVVFGGCLPVLVAARTHGRGFGVLDIAGAAVTIAGIALEAAADLQLTRHRARYPSPAPPLTSGVWALCRHPNYLGELLFWWGLALLGLGAAPDEWWAVCGAVAITVLFVTISIPMMDRRMAERHPTPGSHRHRHALLPLGRSLR